MSTIKSSTNTLLRRYLNGAITAPEEAELERRAQNDPALADAMLGLQSTPEEDHTARVARMTAHARRAAAPNTLRKAGRGRAYWAAAAAVLLLFVSSALVFLPQWLDMAPGEMAMKTKAEAAPTAPEPVPAAALAEDTYAQATITTEAESNGDDAEMPAPLPPTSLPRPRPEKPKPAELRPQAAPVVAAKERQRELPPLAIPVLEDAADLANEPANEVVFEEAEFVRPPPAAARVKRAPLPAPSSKIENDRVDDLFRADEDGNVALVAGNFLEGLITDEDGEPIHDALVRQPGLPLGERTDTSGLFRLSYDATTTLLIVSHPDYLVERIELADDRDEALQISLEKKEKKLNDDILGWTQNAARSEIIFDKRPGYATPREGYRTLRRRIEKNRPEDVPLGKVVLNFLVNQDGTLTDFKFKGQPDRATMDYIGETLIRSSIWEINYGDGEEPVRVHFKVVFE